MDIELLKKAYDAIEMLKALNLPVNDEQLKGIANLERKYIIENVIPTLKNELEPFFSIIRNSMKLTATYNLEEGLNFSFNKNPIKEYSQEGNNSNTRDTRKYSFDGGDPLNKRRFVLAVVKDYVKSHPNVTLDELEDCFPSSLSNSYMHGVVRKYDDIMDKIERQPDLRKRFFLDPEDIITLNDGTKVVVYNQWGTHFPDFLTVAQKLHDVEIHEL